MKSVKILVSGKVQGVWFRELVRKNAVKLDLHGWVKNNPDETVSTEIEGDEIALQNLINIIKVGSPLSKVDNIQIDWNKFENKYKTFKIIR